MALAAENEVQVAGTVGRAPRSWPKRLAAALMLPKEHGAWAMLLMPFLVGTAAARGGGWASALLLASLLLLFSSSRPMELVLQAAVDAEARRRRVQAALRLVAYLGLGGAAGLLLLIHYQRWALLGIGLVAGAALAAQLVLRRRRLDRTWPARLVSIAALSAAGPAAYYAATGALEAHAAAVGWLAFLYSGASVFYVRIYYRPVARHKPGGWGEGRVQAERQLLAYLLVAAVAVVALSALGQIPWLGAFTVALLAAKVAQARARRDYQPSLKQLGLAELRNTTLFALLAVVALATWQ